MIIDKEDELRCSEYKWRKNKRGYWRGWVNSEKLLLHRFIMNAKKGDVIDHISGNKDDNRKSNLRFCTQSQNCMNQIIKVKNISGYKGVTKDGERWKAQIKVNYKNINIGRFKSKEEAALAYNKAALLYHGEFAKLNLIR